MARIERRRTTETDGFTRSILTEQGQTGCAMHQAQLLAAQIQFFLYTPLPTFLIALRGRVRPMLSRWPVDSCCSAPVPFALLCCSLHAKEG